MLFRSIPDADTIIILTSRSESHQEKTCLVLQKHGLRYDRIIFGLPFGERILINDRKPSGLKTAYALNLDRDAGPRTVQIHIDPSL